MKYFKLFNLSPRVMAVLALIVVMALLQVMGVDVHGVVGGAGAAGMSALMMTGEIDGATIMKALEGVESKMSSMSEKATNEIKELGKVSHDTKTALENIGIEQRTFADRLLQLEQKGSAQKDDEPADESVGAQLIKSAGYGDFQKKGQQRGQFGLELKNTITNAVANTFSERRPGIVEGAFRVFTLEDLMVKIPTSSDSIVWVRENVFVNNAAETAEGGRLPQSSITFTTENSPVQNIGHFVKISRQLANDNAAMGAYVNRRMVYGANLRVEYQIMGGNGTNPNLSGLAKVGNFTPHGYSASSLTALNLSPTNRFDLIGKMIGDCAAADYPADVIVLNTLDWWTMRLTKDANGQYILGPPGGAVAPILFGLPVVASNAIGQDAVWVGSLQQVATLHDRETITVELSDSDEDNFQLGLVSVRAMRRLALTVEKPAAARYGDLTPA